MKTLLISDAHLRDAADDNYRRVVEFLRSCPTDLQRLIVNGDFFDAWIGDNRVAARIYEPVLREVDRFRDAGVEVVFVEGNHDFHLRNALGRRGYTVRTGVWELELHGLRARIEHGDLVTGDLFYRLFHLGVHSPLAAGVNALIPDGLAQKFAFGLSHQSRGMLRDDVPLITEKLRAFARGLRDTDVFITGHTHVPMDETVVGEAGPVRVINLGDWVENFTYLWIEHDTWELRRYEG